MLDRAAPGLFGNKLHRPVLGEDANVVADYRNVAVDGDSLGLRISSASTQRRSSCFRSGCWRRNISAPSRPVGLLLAGMDRASLGPMGSDREAPRPGRGRDDPFHPVEQLRRANP
jgi:hypothetical protein